MHILDYNCNLNNFYNQKALNFPVFHNTKEEEGFDTIVIEENNIEFGEFVGAKNMSPSPTKLHEKSLNNSNDFTDFHEAKENQEVLNPKQLYEKYNAFDDINILDVYN